VFCFGWLYFIPPDSGRETKLKKLSRRAKFEADFTRSGVVSKQRAGRLARFRALVRDSFVHFALWLVTSLLFFLHLVSFFGREIGLKLTNQTLLFPPGGALPDKSGYSMRFLGSLAPGSLS
jgi:hypothetical protein